MNTVYLSLKTTGLESIDHITEIAILDHDGYVLLDTIVRPPRRKQWYVGGTMYATESGPGHMEPTLAELRRTILNLVYGKDVVIYNAAAFRHFLARELHHAHEIHCCMEMFARVYGEQYPENWSKKYKNYRWQKFTTAARHVLYLWTEDVEYSRRALDSCRATRAIWRYCTVPHVQKQIEALRLDDVCGCVESEVQLCRRDEVVCARDVQDALFQMEESEQLKRCRYRDAMTAQWMQAMGFSLFAEGRRRDERLSVAERSASEDEYTYVFTGFTPRVRWMMSKYKHLPLYRSKGEMPVHLKTLSSLNKPEKLPKWVIDGLAPVALYVSAKGKQAQLFYDERQVMQMLADAPRRHDEKEPCPSYLKTMAELMDGRGMLSQSVRQHLQVVARKYNRRARDWEDLYDVNAFGRVFWP